HRIKRLKVSYKEHPSIDNLQWAIDDQEAKQGYSGKKKVGRLKSRQGGQSTKSKSQPEADEPKVQRNKKV
ncbi:MAG: hypothetical protein WAO19_03825, partial [Candidatus Kryptoniota bacterium]